MTNFRYHDLLKVLMPKGAVWALKPMGDLDKLLESIGDVKETIRDYIKSIAYVRNPNLTPVLSDLEREFGVVPVTSLTESERRELLAGYAYAKPGSGKDDLGSRLHAAGFTDLHVYQNEPLVDPDYYQGGAWADVCGHQDSVCGHEDAYCGQIGIGGYLLVNGPVYDTDGNEIEYTVPDSSERWPLVFFVGGDKTESGNGYFLLTDGDMEYGTDPDNLLLDGDMDYPDTTFWTGEADTISKELRDGGGGPDE